MQLVTLRANQMEARNTKTPSEPENSENEGRLSGVAELPVDMAVGCPDSILGSNIPAKS